MEWKKWSSAHNRETTCKSVTVSSLRAFQQQERQRDVDGNSTKLHLLSPHFTGCLNRNSTSFHPLSLHFLGRRAFDTHRVSEQKLRATSHTVTPLYLTRKAFDTHCFAILHPNLSDFCRNRGTGLDDIFQYRGVGMSMNGPLIRF